MGFSNKFRKSAYYNVHYATLRSLETECKSGSHNSIMQQMTARAQRMIFFGLI